MKTPLLVLLTASLAASTASAQLFDNLQKFANRITVGDPLSESETGREGPKSICLDDLDADGKLDFAVSNLDGSVSIAFGAGGLLFTEPLHFATGAATLRELICADFNGDGLPDIVTAAPVEGEIHFLWNEGGQQFTLGTPMKAWEITRNLVSGDFNGDGHLDLAAAGRQHGLAVYHGDSDGGFGQPLMLGDGLPEWGWRYKPVYMLRTVRPPLQTKDSLIVVHAYEVEGRVVVESEGKLTVASTLDFAMQPHDFEVAPLASAIEAEVVPDIIAADKGAGVVRVYQLDALAWARGEIVQGEAGQAIPIPGAPRDLEIVDLDGDGWNDLVVVLRNFNRTITFKNNEGILVAVTEMPVGVSPRQMASGHLNDDELPDFVIINRESMDVSVALASDLDAGFESLDQVYPVGGEVTGLELVDLNQDGRDDIVQVHRSSGDVSVRLSGEGGRLGNPRFYPMGVLPSAIELRDLNGDGIKDVMTANLGRRGYAPGSVTVRLAQPNGTFGAAQHIPTEDQSNIFAVEAADFNGDGISDYAVGYFDCRVGFYEGKSDGSFKLTRIDRFTYESRVMVTGDWNQDGFIDVAGAGYAGDVVVHVSDGNLLEKTGKRYDYPPASQGKFGTREITASDTNGDGDLDLLVGSGKGVMLLLGGEGGSFVPQKEPLKGTDFPASSLTQGDMDGDGIDDLAVSCRILSCVTILKGDSEGAFDPAITVDVPAGAFIRSGDVDGDGLTDLVGSGDALWIALSSRSPEAGAPYTGSPKRPPMPQVVINEILPSNNRYRFDESRSETPDCVEIFNGLDRALDMRDWKLRRIDNADTKAEKIQEYTFAGGLMGPKDRLTLFCSTRVEQSHLHTGFKLPADGTTLELLDAEGNQLDRVTYPPMEQNISFARYQDGVDAFRHNMFPDIDSTNIDNGELEPSVFFKGVDFSEMKPNQSFRVTARANDDVGVIALSMVWKSLTNPLQETQRVVLYDDGQHGDGEVLDGFFAGEFPAMAEGEEVQFYVEATDLNNKNTYRPRDPIFAVNRQQLEMVYTFGTSQPLAGQLKIVEVVTDNETMTFDDLEDWNITPDYITLRNDGGAAIDLQGLTVTQNFFSDGRDDYVLPATGMLEPGATQRIYFADKLLNGLAASFPLRKKGDTIYLTLPGEMGARTLVDWVGTPRLASDEAAVRLADGSWGLGTPSDYLTGLDPLWSIGRSHVRARVARYSGRTTILESSDSLTSDSWEAEVILDPTNRDLGWFDPSVRLETISVQREQSDQRFFRLRYETPDQ